jgi:methylated-DNA-[protein]-cysteine S-methyltransferase
MSEHAWLKTRQLGWLHCQGNEMGITRLVFAEKAPAGYGRGGPLTCAALEAIERYLGGELAALDAVSIALAGTAFQKAVWSELRKIRPGACISYAELADRLGRPRAVRAVGQAVAKNPIAMLVPCHRVVLSDGGLGGYAWGQQRKAFLLSHENISAGEPRRRKARAEGAPPGSPQLPAPLPLFERLSDPRLSLGR